MSVDNRDNIDSRWSAFGELLVWVVFFFWAVWLFNAFLPPKSDQTEFETYLSRMMGQSSSGGAAATPSRTPNTQDPWEQKQGPAGWR